jgi:cob(I)alamin adenosyltransferase
MSIATRTGDKGTTGLMYNRRVSKCHPLVEACGSVDEVNSALGLARATATDRFTKETLLEIQNDLIVLMGELATLPEDAQRYIKDGFKPFTPETIAKLDGLVEKIESQPVNAKGWAIPGTTVHAAALDMARVICRRAERRVCALHEAGQLRNADAIVYLNRLSDVLWLLARWTEWKSADVIGDKPSIA